MQEGLVETFLKKINPHVRRLYRAFCWLPFSMIIAPNPTRKLPTSNYRKSFLSIATPINRPAGLTTLLTFQLSLPSISHWPEKLGIDGMSDLFLLKDCPLFVCNFEYLPPFTNFQVHGWNGCTDPCVIYSIFNSEPFVWRAVDMVDCIDKLLASSIIWFQ